MAYSEFLNSSPRIISQLNRFNENYEKKILLDVVNLVIPDTNKNENIEEVIYSDDLSIFF